MLLLMRSLTSFIESDLSDTDNIIIVTWENTTPIYQNKIVKIKERRADRSD